MAQAHTSAEFDAVVLAAGAGRRLGHRPKALLQRDGQALLWRLLHILRQAGMQHTVVVLGHHAPAIEAELLAGLTHAEQQTWPELDWVHTPTTPEHSLAMSLQTGLRALPASTRPTLVSVVDLPCLQASDVLALCQAWHTRGPGIEMVQPLVNGVPGHPLLMTPRMRTELQDCAPAQTGREWQRTHPQSVWQWPTPSVHHVLDVDTPEDMLHLAKHHHCTLS